MASVKIEEGVAVDADVTSRAVEVVRRVLSSVFTPHINTDPRNTTTRLIEYSILRL